MKHTLLVVVGDKGYQSIRVIWKAWKDHQVFVLTNAPYQSKSKLKQWYNKLLRKMNFQWLYAKRGPSVEPAFSLIKELFGLKNESQLPYKGLANVSSFLMVSTLTIQLLMVFNNLEENDLGSITRFKTLLA